MTEIEQVKSFIESLKQNPSVPGFDEAATKQAIILPLLHLLGWNTYNIDEVTPEYSVEVKGKGGRVDYSLRINKTNEVFLEVKKTGEDLANHEDQLLDYSFRAGVELAMLTNGMTWWLYLPTKKGDWKARKFYTVDIIQQDSHDVAQKFVDLLSKASVQKGEALKQAEFIYKGKLKKSSIEDTLPEAWNKLVSEPDSLLVDLLSETTEKLCGFKPEVSEATQFLKDHEGQFLLSPVVKPKKTKVVPPDIHEGIGGERITQHSLIPYIIRVLQKHGGRARKDQVEEDIYQQFKEEFKKPYYQETVSYDVPRWKHNIAWAKEAAKKKGLIKRPDDSGWGIWELTSKGMNS